MPARRSALVKIVALCLLATPSVALGQQKGPAQTPGDSTSHRTSRPHRALSKVIIFGSIGAIVGALSTLRKRSSPDAIDDDGAQA
jgi:hypothetical protein